jgi:TonB family protein
MTLLIESTIEVSLIVLAALAAALLLRNRSAATRHAVLAAAIACAAAAPLLRPVAPSWHVPLGPPRALQSTAPPAAEGPGAAGPAAEFRRADASGASRSPRSVARALGFIWIAGVAFNGLVLIIGLARLARLATRATRAVDGRWVAMAQDIARAAGLARPVQLLQCRHPSLPVTWGVVRPRVLLPSAACDWTDDRMRVVLLHEIAHIRRGDWLTQLAAEGLRTVYWFNPIVWIASRRLRQESEQACDDEVLGDGVASDAYAVHLLALARSIAREPGSPVSEFPAPAMARPSSLERRFTAMLNTHANRRPLTTSTRALTLAGAMAITILVAGLGIAQTFATFSGFAVDSTNRLLPGVDVFLTNTQTQAKYRVGTDRTGRFEFVGLPPGDYTWSAQLAGFANLQGGITISGRDVQRDLSLEVGSLEETLSVRSGGTSPQEDQYSAAEARLAQAARDLERAQCVAGNNPIGGQIRAPRIARRVNPRYPEPLVAAHVGGVVVLDATIDSNGNMRDVTMVRAPHPDLAAAAIEAVSQWQFTVTLLNCDPVEVKMKVTANFVPEP